MKMMRCLLLLGVCLFGKVTSQEIEKELEANEIERIDEIDVQKEPETLRFYFPGETEESRVLEHRIQDNLTSEQNKRVSVKVNGGIVTLRGVVTSEDQRKDILQRVQGVDGVKEINNQLQVGTGGARLQ